MSLVDMANALVYVAFSSGQYYANIFIFRLYIFHHTY
jgi:hypothetical protein